jgi:Baseplate structural protein Gp10, C-terminal domain
MASSQFPYAVPPGGTTGQAIVKCSDADGDCEWSTVGGGTPWPIGAVFVSVVATNPARLLGVGTWQAVGAGRVLVGIDAADPTFDTVRATGGAATVTLTELQIPSHTHTQMRLPTATGTVKGFTVDLSMSGTPAVTDVVTAATGGDGAHTNLQPFFVVYFWERTA